ncbi:MAG: flagellar biosynthesis/type III secretory pathway protein FliH [Planctomycetota bacterium]|jgi:flagellar biosynthesis/type III secretory pathway protein FliH
MSQAKGIITVHTKCVPGDVRILLGSIDELDATLRSQRDDRMRAEGFAQATQNALVKFDESRLTMLDELADCAAKLASEVAEVLLYKEIGEGNYDIVAIVRDTLASSFNAQGIATIHVNPVDQVALESTSFRSGTTIQADPGVRRGNVHIDTNHGLLVRDMDDCLEAVRLKLREMIKPC